MTTCKTVAEAVSYTHLDVSKRQQLEGAPELAALLFLLEAEAGRHFIPPQNVYFLDVYKRQEC